MSLDYFDVKVDLASGSPTTVVTVREIAAEFEGITEGRVRKIVQLIGLNVGHQDQPSQHFFGDSMSLAAAGLVRRELRSRGAKGRAPPVPSPRPRDGVEPGGRVTTDFDPGCTADVHETSSTSCDHCGICLRCFGTRMLRLRGFELDPAAADTPVQTRVVQTLKGVTNELVMLLEDGYLVIADGQAFRCLWCRDPR